MKTEIMSSRQIIHVPDFHIQLANLTETVWRGQDRCYFPYIPLTQPDYWQNEIRRQWETGDLHSWALVDGQTILAHVALVKKAENHYELGRWNDFPSAPRYTITNLSREALVLANNNNWLISVECTQAHTTSQYICEHKLGMRFAGIGILDYGTINGATWDIIYYDNLVIEDFNPKVGILGNPIGKEIPCLELHRKRLAEIKNILTTSRIGILPPTHFHILPSRIETVKKIIYLNL